MITLQTTDNLITFHGETYTVRHVIRAMGGIWDKGDQVWRVPNTPENLAKAQALADSAPIPTPRGLAAKLDEHRQAPSQGPAPDLMAAMAAFVVSQKSGNVDEEAVSALIKKALAPLEAKLDNRPQLIEVAVRQGESEPVKLDGLAHYALPDLIQCLGAGLHVWLAGPSGSGKTHGAEMAAKALGLTFRLQGAMTMAHELTGFVDASGKYHETPFVTSFRDGGLILLDELDAGSNEALLALNAALANAIMCLPSGEIIRAHKDFKCVGAANTFGQGATAEYVGRTRIDAAFLQRFGARINWGYDEALETAMCGNSLWAARVQRARRQAVAVGLKVLITPRASQAGAKLIAAGKTPDQAAKLTYLADLSPAQATQIGG